MEFTINRIAQDLDFAQKIINLGSKAPLIYKNSAISHHLSIAENYLTPESSALLNCAKHEKLAHKIIEITEDEFILSQCAKHLSVAEKLIYHPSLLVRAFCAKHKSLAHHFYESKASMILSSTIPHNHKLALINADHYESIIRNACATHLDIAERYYPTENNARVVIQIASHKPIAMDKWSQSKCPTFLRGCAQHPELAEKLVNCVDMKVRETAARTLSAAKHLINDRYWLVRKECARHPELQEHLFHDAEPIVRSICASNEKYGVQMLDDDSEIVLMQIAYNPATAHLLVEHSNSKVAEQARFISSIW